MVVRRVTECPLGHANSWCITENTSKEVASETKETQGEMGLLGHVLVQADSQLF
jgi:hypothetical protein